MENFHVDLKRYLSTIYGTPGILSINDISFKTIERPWNNNKEDISSIPSGEYTCEWAYSPSWKMNLYHVLNVPDRSGILIHPANVFEELEGCIALGLDFAIFNKDSIRMGIPSSNHIGVTESIVAVNKFEKLLRGEKDTQLPFTLSITEEAQPCPFLLQ